jgi:uncharacterized protein (DUF849 family)/arginase family enzyme
MRFELVGVPYTSMAKPGGIGRAIAVLRCTGLVERLQAAGDVRDAGDLALVAGDGVRGPSGLLNEAALGHLVAATRKAVAASHDRHRVPLLVGGDCPVLLGALAAARDRHGACALMLVDGHEDAWPPSRSPTGEASDSEVAIALGMVGGALPEPLGELVPLVAPDRVALMGPRDRGEIEAEGGSSLDKSVAVFLDDEALGAQGASVSAKQAAATIGLAAPAFWLHVDLDALSTNEFAAVDYPQSGGLTWRELRQIAVSALSAPACAGASVVIYNPDRDTARAPRPSFASSRSFSLRAAGSTWATAVTMANVVAVRLAVRGSESDSNYSSQLEPAVQLGPDHDRAEAEARGARRPVLLQAALNGDRPHPATPRSPDELAAEARAAVDAGARSLHLHPYDGDGHETLASEPCAAALLAVRTACPGIPLSLSTSAGIESDPERRFALVAAWTELPDLVTANQGEDGIVALCKALIARGVGIEAGLLSVADAHSFVSCGLAESCARAMVEPLDPEPEDALAHAEAIERVLMKGGIRLEQVHHGDGMASWAVNERALRRGHGIRTGLEDTPVLPDGRTASGNGELVAAAARLMA